ncbi:major capsid protein [Peromfec virus RodF7_5]|uniref:Major capsid protein n=1 Tax=Peromfec virus RodF7_5 TaxID=2929354 RepID=A0A976N2D7_9VIRU|nr:major capsid protein [Peromfec virus RodF7_5]
MSQKDVKNHVHRNGFDLSFRNTYTAKIGELLPVMCKEIIPGDKFKIDLASLVRTQPVKTAAFTRLKEYYDFYFVPTSLLWDKFDNYIIQTNNYNHARGFQLNPDNFTSHPYFTAKDLYEMLYFLYQHKGDNNGNRSITTDVLGYSAYAKTVKLLEYLGYGNWRTFFEDYTYNAGTSANPDYRQRPFPNNANIAYNPFPLLAYQKICQDYFRNDLWQTSRPYMFNLDYIFRNSDLKLPVANYSTTQSGFWNLNGTIFSLQYANYRKDLFTGLMPRSQFGDTTVASPLIGTQRMTFTSINPVSGDMNNGFIATLNNQESSVGYGYGEGIGPSVFALRFAEFSQKWKEITQSGNLDYQSQIEKHWNVHPSDYQSYRSRWIGGTSNNININEVTNTNLDNENSQAVLAGKGIGTQQKNGVVNFESKGEYGYMICIYHAEPILDWSSAGCERHNLKIAASDYAIPEFDNLGMESLPVALIANTPVLSNRGFGLYDTPSLPDPSKSLGYAPRYFDYKISLDVVRGNFLTTNKDWVSPLNVASFINVGAEASNTLSDAARELPSSSLDYQSFLINPNSVNSIFVPQATGDIESDVLLNSVFFDIKAVRNLSVSGLPY